MLDRRISERSVREKAPVKKKLTVDMEPLEAQNSIYRTKHVIEIDRRHETARSIEQY